MLPLTQSQINSANQIDLTEYLFSRGENLKKVSSEYLWERNNVFVRGNKWYSHYEQTGGYPVEFVMKYFDLPFKDAVRELIGEHNYSFNPVSDVSPQREAANPHLLPASNKNTYRIYMYLKNKRGISPDVINAFAKIGLLYEDREYHSCVFVGRDENGQPRHCHVRSTVSSFKQTMKGSRAEYAFHFNGHSDTIYAFEAPIDMLAYISMHEEGWRQNSYVALCSVSEKALMHQLEAHPKLRKVVLCLDSDDAGQSAVSRIKESLYEKGYTDVQVEIPQRKDWNEDLQVLRGIKQDIKSQETESWTESQNLSLSLF